MKLLLSIFLLLGAHSAGAAQNCPASVELELPPLVAAERNIAQRYANCMSTPMLPSSQGRVGNLAACRANLPARRSDALQRTVHQVERIAINLGPCKTRIKFKSKAKS